MNSIALVLKSRAFWVVVVTFVVNGLQAIDPMLPAQAQVGVTAILSLLTVYFHITPTQSYHGSVVEKDLKPGLTIDEVKK